MPHKFSNCDKIGALSTWIDKMQERINTVKEAINDADTMDRWSDVPDDIRDISTERALKASLEFAALVREQIEPYDRIKVPIKRYDEAEKIANEITEPKYADGWQYFQVPVWATERVVNKLKEARIRHWLNTI